jgi:hypothetical protein
MKAPCPHRWQYEDNTRWCDRCGELWFLENSVWVQHYWTQEAIDEGKRRARELGRALGIRPTPSEDERTKQDVPCAGVMQGGFCDGMCDCRHDPADMWPCEDCYDEPQ